MPDPRGSGKSVLEAKREHELSQAKTDAAKAKLKTGDIAIDALGSGSDYTAFLDHLAIASLNLGFGGDGQSGGVYHSVYDSFYWFTHFSDGDFTHTAGAVARHRHGADAAGRRRHPAVRVRQHRDDADGLCRRDPEAGR